MNILHIGPYNTHVHTVNNVSESIELKDLLHEYNDRFHGLGKLQDVAVKIYTDPNIPSVAQKARHLPILMRKEVDHELDKLLQLDVIEPVTEPSWVTAAGRYRSNPYCHFFHCGAKLVGSPSAKNFDGAWTSNALAMVHYQKNLTNIGSGNGNK